MESIQLGPLLLSLASLATAGSALEQLPNAPISIYAGRVLDGRGGELRRATVVIDQGRILRVEPRRIDAPTYEFPNGTLLPGLIDTHVHISAYINRQGRMHTADDGDSPAQAALSGAANARRTLAAGFTTVQSLGAPQDADLRDWIAAGRLAGPRIVTSLSPIGDPTLTPEQLRAEVARRVEAGADVVKLFASRSIRDGGTPTLDPAQLGAACGEANFRGVRAVVHAHSAESIRAAALAGCHQVEHGLFATDEVLALMAEHDVFFDPQCSLIFRTYLEHRSWFRGIGNFTTEAFEAMERILPAAIDVLRSAIATPHLRVVYGTDAVAGAHGSNVDDLVCRVRQAGQKAADAIVSATGLAAESLGLADAIGTVTPGLQADVIVVAGNPLDDITALRRVVLVMRAGRVERSDPTLAELPGLR